MRWIQKRQEPASLARYRQEEAAAWDGMRTNVKDDIRDALLLEQGHLCAYCMRWMYWVKNGPGVSGEDLSRRNMKIEHWKPRNLLGEAEKLDYQNMLGVCMGHFEGEEDTCDTSKGRKAITVDPRRQDHIDQISYDMQGGRVLIQSEDSAIHKDLTETLNLNANLLPENRHRAYKALRTAMEKARKEGTFTAKWLEKARHHFETPGKGGKLPEYAGFLLWYLNDKKGGT